MKRTLIRLAAGLSCVLLLMCCNPSNNELSLEEKREWDSLSKLAQKRINDSLKKTNPLLILPPDSDYTGRYLDKYPNGIVKFSGYYRFGERHGQWMSFFPSGLAWSEMHYDKGLRQGPNLVYFENGKLRYSGFYKADKQDSLWCYYDSTGLEVKMVMYTNDKLQKEVPVK